MLALSRHSAIFVRLALGLPCFSSAIELYFFLVVYHVFEFQILCQCLVNTRTIKWQKKDKKDAKEATKWPLLTCTNGVLPAANKAKGKILVFLDLLVRFATISLRNNRHI